MGLTLGSLFDGSGGFPLGGLFAGITTLWSSEIEPFPIRVTTKRLPNVKHYGDVSKINGAEIEPVDIITFGSPCQDMSVAGKRVGLEGSRSSLFHQAIRIIKEMRCATNGEYPRFIVWENVPGAFSSNKGEDFKAVLEAVCSVKDEDISVPEPPKGKWSSAGEIMADGFSLAWRVLDAQFWGVPQRRKRIYLVADLAGGSARKILFESEGLSGYSAEGFRAWQGFAGGIENCIGATGESLMFENHSQDARYRGPLEVSQTVSATYGMGGNNQPFVVESAGFCTEHSAKAHGIGYEEETSPTLRAGTVPAAVIFEKHSQDTRYVGPLEVAQTVLSTFGTDGNAPQSNQSGVAVVAVQGSMIGRNDRNGAQGSGVNEEVFFTLNTADRHAVAYPTYCTSKNSQVATDYKDPPVVNDREQTDRSKTVEYIVRRLTPTECARLQGFPDWWCSGLETAEPTEDDLAFWREVFETHRKVTGTSSKTKTDKQIIKWLKAPHSDSAEYKMWGNGVALPNVIFVLSGISYYSEFT